MLDLLLRYATPRNFVIAVIAAAAVSPAVRLVRYTHWRYEQAMYPPVRQAAAAGQDIKELLEKRESEKIEARYREVGARLLQAKADGFDVSTLQDRANEALAYNEPGRRQVAAQILNEVELAVPKKKVQYIPLYPKSDDDMMTDDDTPKPKPVLPPKTAKKAAKTRRGKRRSR